IALTELIEKIGGVIRSGDAAVSITGVEGIERAGPEQLTFIANRKYAVHLETTKAAAIITPDSEEFTAAPHEGRPVLIAHPQPYYAFMLALRIFHPEEPDLRPGIDKTAAVGDGVTLSEDLYIGKNVVVENGAHLGAECRVLAGCYVGRGAKIGAHTTIGPNVTLMHKCELGSRVRIHPGTVIGADGFGYAQLDGVHHKIPQVGHVVIEDDVEIGACVCIDRGTMGETRIKQGTKIDNLVQIAHNVQIGEHSIVVSQVGISGSTKIGKHVVLAGQVGLVGHIEIGDGTIVAAQSGVPNSVPPGSRLLGSPARDLGTEKRIHVLTGKLPEMVKRIKELERRLADLENRTKEL
ncbi:UDP-3-O-(3-hydroxymyristoyl)glucosamine N-acyltransferase, partial [Candidatus Zixiibacteriota bacterium]